MDFRVQEKILLTDFSAATLVWLIGWILLRSAATASIVRVGAWVSRVGRVSGRAVALVLGGGKVNGVVALLLGLERSGLGYTARHEVELGTVDEVLEVLAWGEHDVHAGDVLRRERLAALGTHAGERYPEVAKLVEQDLLSLQQLLHKAAAHVGEHALHLSALVAAVLGDVVNKLAEGHHFLRLCPGVGFRSLVLVHLVGK